LPQEKIQENQDLEHAIKVSIDLSIKKGIFFKENICIELNNIAVFYPPSQ
jgi:hypothetical protein